VWEELRSAGCIKKNLQEQAVIPGVEIVLQYLVKESLEHLRLVVF
jgi:hypothetical protein